MLSSWLISVYSIWYYLTTTLRAYIGTYLSLRSLTVTNLNQFYIIMILVSIFYYCHFNWFSIGPNEKTAKTYFIFWSLLSLLKDSFRDLRLGQKVHKLSGLMPIYREKFHRTQIHIIYWIIFYANMY